MGRSFDVEVLTDDEIDRLLATCTRTPSGIRDKALLAVLAGAGLRLAEALSLHVRDLDLEHYRLTVRRGKGSKRRVVGIRQGSAAIVQAWLAKRRDLDVGARAPVFVQISAGKLGRPLAQANVRQMLKRRAARAGMEKRVHAHGLRHSFAFRMAEAGIELHKIQAQLGHASVATTSRYIAHLNPRDVVAAVAAL